MDLFFLNGREHRPTSISSSGVIKMKNMLELIRRLPSQLKNFSLCVSLLVVCVGDGLAQQRFGYPLIRDQSSEFSEMSLLAKTPGSATGPACTNVIVDGSFEIGGIPSSTWDPETDTIFG